MSTRHSEESRTRRHGRTGEPVAAVVRDVLDASVQKLLVADPIARLGEDPEGVHQARVATRRLRCDLRTFGPMLDPSWARPLRAELRWLGQELGVARDAEVLLGHLSERARALPPEIELEARLVLDTAREEHDAAQARVVDVLHSLRYLDLVDRLVQAAMAPRLSPAAETAGTDELIRLAREPWKRLRREHAALGRHPSDPELHALRIRTKRARYAIEAVARAVGGDAPRALAAALTEVQDVLGAHQDAVVAQGWLLEHVTRAPDLGPAAVYGAGMLAGLFRADARASADAFPAVWRRADRRRLRSWL